MEFTGAKLALFLGKELLVIRRDDHADIPYPNHWDLPGGGREMGESPEQCALRETQEEVGLELREQDLVWATSYISPEGDLTWFFVSHQPARLVNDVRFGSEGQGWALMAPGQYCAHPLAVPHFADRLRSYLETL
ncbi:NUDIX hydrolase [Aliisedimentitalea scapharcae]|uniref:NUDIX hydrolase n=1 Tax=Aliisedimentitalea scapharcae TaxID=1524259 RepID=A0ABZ2XU71_9RHOB|nr:NUDIX hydrolase [Rhodobacteraceae bacterium M382]